MITTNQLVVIFGIHVTLTTTYSIVGIEITGGIGKQEL